jgi:hypothetical protein
LIFTCIGMITNSLIGFIEGLVYLTLSNEEYDRRYHILKQGWF